MLYNILKALQNWVPGWVFPPPCVPVLLPQHSTVLPAHTLSPPALGPVNLFFFPFLPIPVSDNFLFFMFKFKRYFVKDLPQQSCCLGYAINYLPLSNFPRETTQFFSNIIYLSLFFVCFLTLLLY